MRSTGVVVRLSRGDGGQVFVALRGQHADGTAFARQAIERGAAAIVSEQPAPDGVRVPWAMVEDARLALAVRRRRVLPRSQPRDAGDRHHRHQRQDARPRISSRRFSRRPASGAASSAPSAYRIGDERRARRRARRRRRRTCRRLLREMVDAAAARARWKCRRTRCRCDAWTG